MDSIIGEGSAREVRWGRRHRREVPFTVGRDRFIAGSKGRAEASGKGAQKGPDSEWDPAPKQSHNPLISND